MTTQDARPIKIEVNLTNLRRSARLDDMNFTILRRISLPSSVPQAAEDDVPQLPLKLMPTSEGDIYIDGEPANPQKHNISFVFKSLPPWHRARKRRLRHGNQAVGQEAHRRQADAILPRRARGHRRTLPNQVSASMVQRIAVARAFAVERTCS